MLEPSRGGSLRRMSGWKLVEDSSDVPSERACACSESDGRDHRAIEWVASAFALSLS